MGNDIKSRHPKPQTFCRVASPHQVKHCFLLHAFPCTLTVHATAPLSLRSWVLGSTFAGKQAGGSRSLLNSRLRQMDNSNCTFFKGATSGRWQLMATSQSPAHYRKGGLGCPPTLRPPQYPWRTETSTSSKVPVLGWMRHLRPRAKRPPALGQKGGGVSIPA